MLERTSCDSSGTAIDGEPNRSDGRARAALVGSMAIGLAAASAAAIVPPAVASLPWLYWALGATMGVVAAGFGARGAQTAALVALLSLGAMFAGRSIAMHSTMQHLWQSLCQQSYELTGLRAREFAKLPEDAELVRIKRFMVLDGYARQRHDATEVTDEEVADFLRVQAPMLRTFAAEQPTLETWLAGDPSPLAGLEEPRLIDSIWPARLEEVLFALLGMATAYVLVKYRRRRAEASSPAVAPR